MAGAGRHKRRNGGPWRVFACGPGAGGMPVGLGQRTGAVDFEAVAAGRVPRAGPVGLPSLSARTSRPSGESATRWAEDGRAKGVVLGQMARVEGAEGADRQAGDAAEHFPGVPADGHLSPGDGDQGGMPRVAQPDLADCGVVRPREGRAPVAGGAAGEGGCCVDGVTCRVEGQCLRLVDGCGHLPQQRLRLVPAARGGGFEVVERGNEEVAGVHRQERQLGDPAGGVHVVDQPHRVVGLDERADAAGVLGQLGGPRELPAQAFAQPGKERAVEGHVGEFVLAAGDVAGEVEERDGEGRVTHVVGRGGHRRRPFASVSNSPPRACVTWAPARCARPPASSGPGCGRGTGCRPGHARRDRVRRGPTGTARQERRGGRPRRGRTSGCRPRRTRSARPARQRQVRGA